MKTSYKDLVLINIRDGKPIVDPKLRELHLDLFRNIGWSVGVVFKIVGLDRPARVTDIDWEGF